MVVDARDCSSAITPALHYLESYQNGVRPGLSGLSGLKPSSLSRIFTTSSCPITAAQESGVRPALSGLSRLILSSPTSISPLPHAHCGRPKRVAFSRRHLVCLVDVVSSVRYFHHSLVPIYSSPCERCIICNPPLELWDQNLLNKLPVGAGSPNSTSCSDNYSEFRGFEEVIEGCKNLEQRLFLNLRVVGMEKYYFGAPDPSVFLGKKSPTIFCPEELPFN